MKNPLTGAADLTIHSYALCMRNAILVGIGKMGSVWADEITDCDDIRLDAIVDTDKNKRVFAHNIGSEWYNGMSEIPEDKIFDIWFITTPVENHFEYMKKAIEFGAETVFVEKPSSSTPRDSNYILNKARENNVGVAVDYIERKNPVVSSIISDINNENFKPSELVHWRGKTSDSVVPFMRDDFCHDISEIELLLSETGEDFSNLSVSDVDNLRTWDESERDESAHFDVGATINMKSNNIKVKIKGAFDESETRRYFLWIDENEKLAYFGNTVTRENITPVALRITGKSNIKTAKDMCVSGYPINDTTIEDFADKTNSNRLQTHKVQSSKRIISDISRGDISPCSLKTAYKIEKKIKTAYKIANLEDIYN